MIPLDVTINGLELLWSVTGLSLFTLLVILLLRRYFHSRSISIIPPDKNDRRISERNKYGFADVFRFRAVFLQFGLVFSLGLAVLGFAWTVYDGPSNISLGALELDPELLVSPPPITPPAPPPPPPPPPVVQALPDDEVLDQEEPEFVDVSISETDAVVAPELVAKETPPPLPPAPVEKDEGPGEVFKFVEEMPLFPGCEDLPTKEERKLCSDRELMGYLNKNIKYPAIARENGIEGIAVISFVVEKNGTITDARIVRAPGGGLGEEALRVVHLMNEKGLKWTPGKQRFDPVRVQFNLPVRFKLQ